jgi:hypothetical protein
MSAGATIAIIVQAFLALVTTLHIMWAGLGAAIVAGLLKEASDWMQNKKAADAGLPAPHGVEFLDIVATAAGGAIIDLIVAAIWRYA